MNIPTNPGKFFSYSAPTPVVSTEAGTGESRYPTLEQLLSDGTLTELDGAVPTLARSQVKLPDVVRVGRFQIEPV